MSADEPMVFGFLKGADSQDKKRSRLEDGGTLPQHSARTTGSGPGSTTHTEDGVHIRTALTKITDALENLELRTRHLETATYITLSVPPDHLFLATGLKATKDHKDLVDKQRKDGRKPKERKECGGASLYVGLQWMTLCGLPEARSHFADTGLAQLVGIFTKGESAHDMNSIFSHSQSWMQRDGKSGFSK